MYIVHDSDRENDDYHCVDLDCYQLGGQDVDDSHDDDNCILP